MTGNEKRTIASIYEAIRKNPENLEKQLVRLERLASQSTPPTLRDDWKTVMESILMISERVDKLRGTLHKVVLGGEFELVLWGSRQKAQGVRK